MIDGPANIDLAWFQPDDTVLITAGASARKPWSKQCIDLLKREFNATVEEHSIREEQVYFALPRELRMLTTQPG